MVALSCKTLFYYNEHVMAKYQLKTVANNGSVKEYIDSIKDKQRKKDCQTLLSLMKKITGKKPLMWGKSIVGFGSYHYKASNYESEWFRCGFSSRKQYLTIYLISGYDKMKDLLKKLGKATNAVSCLYIKGLSDVDINVLKEMIVRCLDIMQTLYPEEETKT